MDNTNIAASLGEQYQTLYGFDVRDASADGRAPAPYAVLPAGKSLHSLKPILDQYREKPERRSGTSSVRTAESFVDMVGRFASPDSAIFANPNRVSPSVLAVFDYYPKTAEDGSRPTDWLKHRTQFAPELSEEWKTWIAQNGRSMKQADFAAFIEGNVTDLRVANLDGEPALKTYSDLVDGRWASPSDMVGLSRKLQVNVASAVKSAQTLSSGELSLQYETVHQNGEGQPLKIANLFRIAIPVFYLGGLYALSARLRYSLAGGAVSWSYDLVRPEQAFEDAFAGIIDEIRKATTVPVFFGTPEA